VATVLAPPFEAVSPAAVAGLSREEVYRALATHRRGLSSGEAAARLARVGSNTLAPPASRRLLRKFGANFVHVMAILLWVGGVAAFVARLPQLGIAVWSVNLINGVFSFWQEYQAEKATEALRRLLPSYATVLRDGEAVKVPAEELVPGDVVLLAEGDRVSADARLVDQTGLRVDQSTLTGESRPVRKTAHPVEAADLAPAELPNLVFAGTAVAAGRGVAVVSATGTATQFGRVAALTQAMAEEPSPLQVEMRRLTYVVSAVAVGVGVVFFFLALWLGDLSLARGFIFTLGMIVAFVPEGLLPTVTLALAMGTQRMARRNALVKRLSAVETLGCTSVICTDKTGTLTQNEMTVRRVLVAGGDVEVTGVGYEPAGELRSRDPATLDLARRVLEAGALACDARLVPPAGEETDWSVVGDPTEGAILVAAHKAGLDSRVEAGRDRRAGEIPFDSGRKRMSALDREEGGLVVHVKGSPAELVERCRRVWTAEGVQPLDAGVRERMAVRVEACAREGLRVLAVARRSLDRLPAQLDADLVERDLELLGFVAMHDPPRPEVTAAIEKCRRAGIRIVMITGDFGLTAESIGRRIGLYGPEPVRVVNGDELGRMGDDELATLLRTEVLFARATPEHKLRIVSALQRLGEVVAVTGDGVNDAPALKKADIGVAMGLSGTDVAKEAADMILLDDNFASIVAAVEEGRGVYANIRKFTTYILTSNTPEAVPFVAFAFSGGRIPIALDVMHVLAIDLGTDLAPALALGAETPEPGVMEQPPRSRAAHVIDRHILARAYLWLGPLQSAFVMAAFFFQYWTNGYAGQWLDLPGDGAVYRGATAMALAAVVATQIGNLFAQRTERTPLLAVGLGGNRLLWWGVASEVVLIALIVYWTPLGGVIGTGPFPALNWLWLLGGIPILPLADEVRKARARRAGARRARRP
jgi:magnesium-transporting ATPase (P-type)